jgi:cyclase
MKSPLPIIACAAAVILLVSPAAPFAQENPSGRQEAAAITLQPITVNIYLVKGGAGSNAGLIVGTKDVVAVDAMMTPESVQRMIAELNKTSPRKVQITKIILTHGDADHINGLPGFPRGLTIISQEHVKDDMTKAAADSPDLLNYLPTQVFKNELKFACGQDSITLSHYGPAHTNGDTVVYIDNQKTAYVGDLVFLGRDPVIHLAKGGSSEGLVKTLKAILSHRPHISTFIPGHGEMVTRDEVANLIRTIEIKQYRTRTLLADGKSLDEIKKILEVDMRPPADGKPAFPSLVEIIYQELTEKKGKA